MSTLTRLTLCVSALCLAPAVVARAQDACQANAQAMASTETVQGSCGGPGSVAWPSFPLEVKKRYNMGGQTNCQDNNYYAFSQSSSQDVAAWSTCGPTGNDTPPMCMPSFDGPYQFSFGQWFVYTRNGTYSTESGLCGLSGEANDVISIAIEGCVGTTCCGDARSWCTATYGVWENEGCRCTWPSPIIVSLGGNDLHLTNAAAGVDFDLFGQGRRGRWAWTRAASDDAFLALDRDGDGLISSGKELFGTVTEQPEGSERNGFRALKVFDLNGDNRVDAGDSVFDLLRLWFDRNHNGISEPTELVRLPDVGVVAFSLDYRVTSRRDAFGNSYRFASPVEMRRQHATVMRTAWDVFLVGK